MARVLGSYPIGRWFESYCRYQNGPLVKRLRHRPFTAESWVQFPYGSPHHIPTNAYISAFVGFCFLRKLPLSIVCPLFLNVLCISPKFWFRGVFFKPFFHHFYLCFYGSQVLRIQRYLPSPVPVGTCDCRCLRLYLYEHDLMHPIPQPHLFQR